MPVDCGACPADFPASEGTWRKSFRPESARGFGRGMSGIRVFADEGPIMSERIRTGFGPWIRTIRHLTAGQVGHRCRHFLRKRWWRFTRAKCPLPPSPAPLPLKGLWAGLGDITPTSTTEFHLQGEMAMAQEVCAGRFSFLGRTLDFSKDVDWHSRSASQLWRYHLHYFGYIRALLVADRVAPAPCYFFTFRRLAVAWIEGNRLLQGDGWHPYTLSLRLVNWLQAWMEWQGRFEADPVFRSLFLNSLFAQARLLRRQLELDVRGNHLLENLRALLWTGSFFSGAGPREWFATAFELLREETAEQVLADGGHFERTPGYHVAVLRLYLEIALLLERNGAALPDWLRDAIRRQAMFLREILGPNGRLPLLKDTACDAAPDPSDVLNAAAVWLDQPELKAAAAPGAEAFLLLGRPALRKLATWDGTPVLRGCAALAASGFYIFRGPSGEHAILDLGKPCPDYLPAHAHADTFSFEYHFKGKPVVVDSGIFEYAAGPWRSFFRSTRAHNTVEVGNENSSEVWASFRVGRRARPEVKQWVAATDEARLLASHDGYRHLPGQPRHERAVLWRAGVYFIVLDRVTADRAVPIANHIHFHPEIEPVADGEARWRMEVAGTALWVHRIGAGAVERARGVDLPAPQGWYSERFGTKIPNTVLSLVGGAATQIINGYLFSPERDLVITVTDSGAGTRLGVKTAAVSRTYLVTDTFVEIMP